MRRQLAPIMLAAATLTGCGGGEQISPSQELAAIENYTDKYGCAIQDIEIEYVDLTDHEVEIANNIGVDPESVSVGGYTDYERIYINENSTTEEMISDITHETGHACSDKSQFRELAIPLRVSETQTVTHIEGFSPVYNNASPENASYSSFTLIEEGVINWLIEDLEGVDDTTHGAKSSVEVTEQLSSIHMLDKSQVAELLHGDKLIEFLGYIYKREPSEIYSDHIIFIMNLYLDAYNSGLVPTANEISEQIEYYNL